jgi:hypothetical protein
VIAKLIKDRKDAGLLAPEQFAKWMSSNRANDRKHGRKVYRYHPRSDEHSKRLCALVLDDLKAVCPPLAEQINTGEVLARINAVVVFDNGKTKALDLAIGEPTRARPGELTLQGLPAGTIGKVRLSCEAKQCMTEHSKTKPRIFDELSSSHEIVHQGESSAIATGIVVVNAAPCFASPLRQLPTPAEIIFSKHSQPKVTADMVRHLRGLKRRDGTTGVGFDAFATIVVDCDNTSDCSLVTSPPAPQLAESDHYEPFLLKVASSYAERYG